MDKFFLEDIINIQRLSYESKSNTMDINEKVIKIIDSIDIPKKQYKVVVKWQLPVLKS
jgi:hypothetical protein